MGDINFYIEQPRTQEAQKNVCASYLVEMMKEKQKDDSKKADLDRLKEKKLLSIEETAELYGIGRSKLYEITNAEDCPFVLWIGGHRKIKKEAFEEYIMRQYSV